MHKTNIVIQNAYGWKSSFTLDQPGAVVKPRLDAWITGLVGVAQAGGPNVLGDPRMMAAALFSKGLTLVGEAPLADVDKTDTITVVVYSPNVTPMVTLREGYSSEEVDQAFEEMAEDEPEDLSSGVLVAFKYVLSTLITNARTKGLIDAFTAGVALQRISDMEVMPEFNSAKVLKFFVKIGVAEEWEVAAIKQHLKNASATPVKEAPVEVAPADVVKIDQAYAEQGEDDTPAVSDEAKRRLKAYVERGAQAGLPPASLNDINRKIDLMTVQAVDIPEGLGLPEAINLFRSLNLIDDWQASQARDIIPDGPLPVELNPVDVARNVLSGFVDQAVRDRLASEYEVAGVRRRIAGWDGNVDQVNGGWDLVRAISFMQEEDIVTDGEARFFRQRAGI